MAEIIPFEEQGFIPPLGQGIGEAIANGNACIDQVALIQLKPGACTVNKPRSCSFGGSGMVETAAGAERMQMHCIGLKLAEESCKS